MKRSSSSRNPAARQRDSAAVDEFGAETFALAGGFHGDEAEMGLCCARLDEDAGDELALVFAQEESAVWPHLANSVGVDAFPFDIGTFGHESAVDEADDGVDVRDFGGAECEQRHGDILGRWRRLWRRLWALGSWARPSAIGYQPISFFNLRNSDVGWMPRILAAWVLLLPVAVRTSWM